LPLSGLAGNIPASCREKNTPPPHLIALNKGNLEPRKISEKKEGLLLLRILDVPNLTAAGQSQSNPTYDYDRRQHQTEGQPFRAIRRCSGKFHILLTEANFS
jgi:hypothetical protein